VYVYIYIFHIMYDISPPLTEGGFSFSMPPKTRRGDIANASSGPTLGRKKTSARTRKQSHPSPIKPNAKQAKKSLATKPVGRRGLASKNPLPQSRLPKYVSPGLTNIPQKESIFVEYNLRFRTSRRLPTMRSTSLYGDL
jgi:hypothetical protein